MGTIVKRRTQSVAYNLQRRKHVVEEEREYLEDFDEEPIIWKRFFSLICEPVWYNLIIYFGLYSSIVSFWHVDFIMNNRNTKVTKSGFFYLCDLCCLIDIVLRTSSVYIKNLSIDLVSPPRKLWIFIGIDIISIFPFELCFYSDKLLYQLVALNRPLKIFHSIYIFNHINCMVNDSIIRYVIQLAYFMTYFTFLISTCILAITCSIQPFICNYKDNDERAVDFILFILKTVGGNLMTTGFGLLYYQPYLSKFFAVLTNFSVFFGVFIMYTANISFTFIANASHKSNFRYKLKAVNKFFKIKKGDEKLIKLLKNFFDKMWSMCDGYEGHMAETNFTYGYENFTQFLPKSINMEIFTDICWATYGHSKLFNQMDIAFLREISCVMKQQVYVNGQYVYHKNDIKDTMIYVVSGTIQIISPEDEETPLLSLSVGTCLGESSIVVPYKSIYAVKCLTPCVLQILEREEFLKVALKYPTKLRVLVNDILERYRKALTLHEIKKLVNNKPRRVFNHALSSLWINFTLHKLMACKDRDSAYTHAVQNVYLQDNITSDTFKTYLFEANYLSMLAITQRVELNSDTLFIKSSFPYLLKSNTGLVLFFDIVVAIESVIATTGIPIVVISEVKGSRLLYTLVYVFTILWILDILIKLSTTVHLQQRTLTNRMKIFIYRLSEPTFILDLFCAWPFEVFSSILVKKEAANVLYLNRTLKIYKVFQLLYLWEKRYNSNYLLVRTLGVVLLLLYGITIASTIFLFMVCSNTCSIKELHPILFFSTQTITGVALDVPIYSNLPTFYGVHILMFLIICIFFAILYGLLISASIFSELNLLTIKYKNLSLIKMVKSLKSKTLTQRVEREAALQINTSYGLNILSPNYIFENFPRHAIGYFFRNVYLDWLCLLPFLKHIPKYIVLDILQACAILENLESHVFICHVGELFQDFIILADGQCESVSGDTYTYRHIKGRTALNDLEMALDIPSRNTINTKTDCDIIRIPYLEMRKVLLKYHPKKYKYRRIEDLKYKAKNMKNITPSITSFRYLYETKTKSFVRHNPPSSGYRNIHAPYVHSCFKNFLLPITILPTGKFYQRWEISRCVFALISSALYSTTSLSTFPFPHPIAFILLFLNITLYVDLYIQAHVCYYNAKGIFITHPLMTMNNYVSTRFLFDFIATIPFHYIFKKRKFILINITKILQLHHYLEFTHYKVHTSVTPPSKLYMFKNIPVHLILINLYASIFLIWNCDIDNPTDPNAITCSANSVFVKNELKEKLTPLKAHLYSFYIVFSTISTISIQGFKIIDITAMVFLGILSIFGVYWTISITASVYKYYLYDHFQTLFNDIKVKRLYKFMETENVRKALVSKVDKHLVRCNLLDPYNAHKYTQKFSSRIKRDILYERFGKILSKVCLKHGSDVDQFIRNILIHTEYLVIDKNGYAQTINDVTDEVSILFTGVLEIVAADGEVLVQLSPGTLFGNLCNIKYNRMKISAVAQGTLEVLKIKTLKFFEILNHFKSTREEFFMLHEIHSTHIPGYSRFIYPKKLENIDFIYKNNPKILFFIEIFLLIVGAYLGVVSYLYQISKIKFDIKLLIIDIVCDISFGILIILNINNPMYAKIGVHNDSSKNFSRFFFNKNKMFWFSVVTCIPTEVWVYFMPVSLTIKWYLFLFLKAIVLFRFKIFLFRYEQIYRHSRRNMFLYKFVFAVLIVLFFMIGSCSIIIIICSYLKLNLHGSPPSETTSRFENYVTWMYVISNILMRCSQVQYYPNDFLLLAIFIVFLVFVALFSSALFAKIIAMVESKNGPKRRFVLQLKRLFSFLINLEASLSMTERVSYYIDVLWFKLYGMTYPDILNEFPLYLKEAILQNALGHNIDCHPVFAKCHMDFKRQLHNYLRINYYHNGDYIQFKGIVDNTMFWVHFGEVVSLSEASDYSDDIVKTYRKGYCFGTAQGLVDKAPHNFSFRAVTYTCILFLVKNEWEHLMPFFPASAGTIKKMGKQFLNKEKEFLSKLAMNDFIDSDDSEDVEDYYYL